jgi:hypothetical protein
MMIHPHTDDAMKAAINLSTRKEPRRDVFAHFERKAIKSARSPSEYQDIQMKWAEARTRRDNFLQEHSHLKQKIGEIAITVRPQLGSLPYRFELVVTIPEGVKKNELVDAESEIHAWRECLTNFQGPRAFMGLEHVACFKQLRNGNYKFVHAEWVAISNRRNEELVILLEDSEYHKDDSPPENPPWNSEWCLREARELLSAWKILNQARWINQGVQNIRAGKPAFETHQARNGIRQLKGPFTPRLVEKFIRAWRRSHKSLPTQADPTKD